MDLSFPVSIMQQMNTNILNIGQG